MNTPAIETPAATVEAPTKKTLIHTRDEADQKVLQNAYPIEEKFGTVRYVHGLSAETQLSLISARNKGTEVATTGLPLDIAGKLGEVTLVRCWNKKSADGSSSSGSRPAANYFAAAILNQEAFTLLKGTKEWNACFPANVEDADF